MPVLASAKAPTGRSLALPSEFYSAYGPLRQAMFEDMVGNSAIKSGTEPRND